MSGHRKPSAIAAETVYSYAMVLKVGSFSPTGSVSSPQSMRYGVAVRPTTCTAALDSTALVRNFWYIESSFCGTRCACAR
eukprot:1801832-Prymnesium_polylepis.2